MSKNVRVLIAGGGTGGHLFPAVAIGDTLKKSGVDVLYIGSKYGIESRLLPDRGESPVLLNIRGFHRTFSIKNILDNLFFPIRVLLSYIKSRIVIKDFNPQVVVGTGGYSSGLPLLAAVHSGIKTLIQEQNSYPGYTTRKLASKANKVCIGFKESASFIKKKTLFTGNPVREDVLITPNNNTGKDLGLDADKFTIFISGGSQGSKPINSHLLQNLSFYKNLNTQLIWQCGQRDYNFISTQDLGNNIYLYDFIKDIGNIYAISDIVISRSGALSVSEILVCGKASILIPYPQAAADHQHINAKATTDAGASILVPQKELELGVLEETVMSLITNPGKIKKMEKAALSISKPNATKEIVDEIYKLILN